MSNLPDRLGDSDTSALLKHGRAYGVTAAIAVGAIAYMSGGISGVEMGGAVAATAPAPATYRWRRWRFCQFRSGMPPVLIWRTEIEMGTGPSGVSYRSIETPSKS